MRYEATSLVTYHLYLMSTTPNDNKDAPASIVLAILPKACSLRIKSVFITKALICYDHCHPIIRVVIGVGASHLKESKSKTVYNMR